MHTSRGRRRPGGIAACRATLTASAGLCLDFRRDDDVCLTTTPVIGASESRLHLERGRFRLSCEPRSRETAANERPDRGGGGRQHRHERGSPALLGAVVLCLGEGRLAPLQPFQGRSSPGARCTGILVHAGALSKPTFLVPANGFLPRSTSLPPPGKRGLGGI